MTRWWNTHSGMISDLTSVSLWALVLGGLGLPVSIAVQLERTRRVLGFSSRKPLLQPVLTAHGVNVLLPSLLGDLYEIGALANISGVSIHRVLVRLIHRFATTLCALGVLAALALVVISLPLAAIVLTLALVGPFIVDLLTPRWSTLLRLPGIPPPTAIQGLGSRETVVHIGLAVAQHSISAAGLFFLGLGIGEPIQVNMAAGMLSVADLITYLPVPVGGIGVHHWSTTVVASGLGALPASLIAIHHAWVVLVGSGCIGVAYSVRDRAE